MSQMYGGMTRQQILQKQEVERRKKDLRGKEFLPPIAENAPMTMGGPKFNPPATGGVGPSAPPAAPLTRTISNLPPGYSEQQVRQQLLRNGEMRRRMAIQAMSAGAAGDTATQEAIIRQRHDLEDDTRTLGATLPQTYTTKDGALASRADIIRKTYAVQRYADAAKQKQPEMDPALAAGMRMAPANVRKPMSNPADEAMRQDNVRFMARSTPTLEGTGMDMQVTNPANQEMERRGIRDRQIMREREERAKRFEESFNQPIDGAAIDARFEDQQARSKEASRLAPEVLARYAAQRVYRDSATKADMDLDMANRQADVAQAQARSTGTDTASEIAKLQATGQLMGAKRELQQVGSMDADVKASGLVEEIDVSANAMSRGQSQQAISTFNEALGQLEQMWPQLSDAKKTEISVKVREIANRTGQSLPTWLERIFWDPLAGGKEGFEQRVNPAVSRLRGLGSR